MKNIVISIANDFDKDRRMLRSAKALQDYGYGIRVIAKETHRSLKRQNSIPANHLRCIFKKGFLFYLEFNIRLLVLLLRTPADILLSVDSDTLLANTLASVVKGKPLIIDMHELFTEVPELAGHPIKKFIWKWIEKIGIAQSIKRYTVGNTIAEEYQNRYGQPFDIIRNVPLTKGMILPPEKSQTFTLVYIGALNIGRGLEELIYALKTIDDVHLVIYGTGDLEKELQSLVNHLKLADRIQLMGWIHPADIHDKLQKAHVGVNLLDPSSKSYYLSLANKYFDYIHAELPILSMNFPEYQRLNSVFRTSLLINDLQQDTITSAIEKIRDNTQFYQDLYANCQDAKREWNWHSESSQLISIFEV